MTLSGRRVVLGVSGGIACYKACSLARRLTQQGASVEVVLTAAAREFVGPVTFEALTGRPAVTSLWDPGVALDHVRLAHDPDLIVIAPATANVLARASQGIADDFLTALLLAADIPVLAAPAMNDDMYERETTRENIDRLRARGWTMLGPATGPLAEGPSDRPGRMVEPDEILAVVERTFGIGDSALAGRRVVVTAGATRESIDPVRLITNRSSGRMGFELARRAWARGADVTLITGPSQLAPPFGVSVVEVESTSDLHDAVGRALPGTDVLVMAAAPADYRVENPAVEKRPRKEGALTVTLVPTPDILEGTRDRRKPGAVMVGFALETGDGVARARAKLERKGLDLIVLNYANEDGAGFETMTNRVTLIRADGEESLPLLSKADVADRILDAIEPGL